MPAEIAPQQIIADRYKVLTILNHGSFGVVSLAKDLKGKSSLVALKCIHKQQDSGVDEAQEEINVHRILGQHQYIAPLLDHFETQDSTFLVMEYYPEGDLYEAIRAGRGPTNVLQFMLQLIEAVEYAHSKGVYHRDIKPENILIANDGSVRLADWGLSTTFKENTEFGVGSERYMAPELFDANIESYNAAKADIWSIGICLLNLLFSRNPFTIACQKDKLFMDFAASREALFDIFPTLSVDTFSVLRHALTIDPDNRSLGLLRNELYNVSTWTTDDEYYCDDVEDEYYDDFSRNVSVGKTNDSVSTTALCDAIVSTNATREPLRTPSYLPVAESFTGSSYTWDRTMQFTPPTSFLDTKFKKTHGHSRLSEVVTKQSSLPMESVNEEDEFETLDAVDEFHHEDEVFSMDCLGSALEDAESVSSLPSLVPSSKGYNSMASSISFASSVDTSSFGSTPGKSWSDLIFDDEAGDDFDDDELDMAVSNLQQHHQPFGFALKSISVNKPSAPPAPVATPASTTASKPKYTLPKSIQQKVLANKESKQQQQQPCMKQQTTTTTNATTTTTTSTPASKNLYIPPQRRRLVPTYDNHL